MGFIKTHEQSPARRRQCQGAPSIECDCKFGLSDKPVTATIATKGNNAEA
jgi:hypothetical protein